MLTDYNNRITLIDTVQLHVHHTADINIFKSVIMNVMYVKFNYINADEEDVGKMKLCFFKQSFVNEFVTAVLS